MKQEREHKYVMQVATNSEELLERLMNTVSEAEIGCVTSGNAAYTQWCSEWSEDEPNE